MNKRLLLAGSIRIFTRYKLRSFFIDTPDLKEAKALLDDLA